MTSKTGTMFGPTLREMSMRQCRVAGQGLIKGRDYLLCHMEYEATGKDMLTTQGTVHAMNGEVFEINNMHIAFDLEDLFAEAGI